MSQRLMPPVWDLQIPARQKLTMLCLALKGDEAGMGALPLARLALLVGCTPRTLRHYLGRLEAAGLVSCTHQGDQLLYRLHLALDGAQSRDATREEGER
jgi:hypothetical protein